MKVIPIALASHMAGETTSVAHLLFLKRVDANNVTYTVALTSANSNVTINDITYLSEPGLSVTSVVTTSGLAVDSLQLATLNSDEIFTNGDMLSGAWFNAQFLISRYNWQDPTNGVEVVLAGTVGIVSIQQSQVVVELRGLQQYFQQTIADVTSKTCRARFGDSRCTKSLSAFTFSGTVMSTTSSSGDVFANQRIFYCNTLTQGDDYFGNGVLRWTSGANEGLEVTVKTFVSYLVTLTLPMFYPVVIGDTFDIIAGCRHRLVEDCLTKFNNVLNFQGEPHIPGMDKISASPA